MTLIFKGLSDNTRLAILTKLLEKDKMTFTDMKKIFKLNSSSITNHLKILQDANLIKNYYEKKGNKITSYYAPTNIPQMLFDAIYDILYPTTSKSIEKNIQTEMKEMGEFGNMIDNLWNMKNTMLGFGNEIISANSKIRAQK